LFATACNSPWVGGSLMNRFSRLTPLLFALVVAMALSRVDCETSPGAPGRPSLPLAPGRAVEAARDGEMEMQGLTDQTRGCRGGLAGIHRGDAVHLRAGDAAAGLDQVVEPLELAAHLGGCQGGAFGGEIGIVGHGFWGLDFGFWIEREGEVGSERREVMRNR
jgi:hypothetical protein